METIRHLSEFSPASFGQQRVDVIGAGATGSRVVMSLAKLGVPEIHVWDFDKVESHNIANQIFGICDIGKQKVHALAQIVTVGTGTDIIAHDERVDGSQQLGQIVFLLTDTMSSRREIFERALKYKMRTKFVIETRMGADNGRVYAFNPAKKADVDGWEETLYDDAVTEVSACGATISIGPTAESLSGFAVWQFIKWFQRENGKETTYENEVIFSLKPFMFMSRNF